MKSLALFLVFIFATAYASGQVVQPMEVPPLSKPIYKNVTKIVIEPRFKSIRLKAGESVDFEVTLKNPNDKDVLIKPKVISNPLSGNAIPPSWISFDKTEFTLKAKESAKVRVSVSVPKDAEKGFYYCTIAFTDDKILPPSPYGQPIYVNSLRLSVNVYIPPSVTITPRFISDFVEAGKTYEYKIRIKNNADRSFSLKPEFVEPQYVFVGNYLKKEDVTIISPSTIPPNSVATVTVRVRIPENAQGILRGTVKLNINDPGLNEWMQRVELSLNVFRVPTEPFVKTVKIQNASELVVKVSTNPLSGFIPIPYWRGKGGDIEVKIVSPSGVVKVRPKVIEKIVVTTGYSSPPWEETEGIYKVVSQSKTLIYDVKYPESGVWRIEVLPKSCMGFEMEVTIE